MLASACAENTLMRDEEILDWLRERQKSYRYSVREVPLESLKEWSFDERTGDLAHRTGKFFTVRGVDCRVSGEVEQHWQQPIIDQPEIGILGFIAKQIGGVMHVLVQAKMEPGNVNLVQLSPTVQATRSNYTMVHGGKRPRYIEYFLGEKNPVVLYDQLQSEQGTRYFRKRNRNIIVAIPEDADFEAGEDFAWMTIGQLQRMTRFENLVHLDCRSILGGICYADPQGVPARGGNGGFGSRVLASMTCGLDEGEHRHAEVLSWFAGRKFTHETSCDFIPLNSVKDWELEKGKVRHREHKFFSVVGVAVEAESREVTSWTQPLVKSNDGGIIALVFQMRQGILHVLVQARIEPGLMDIAELAPTVQCTPENYSGSVPPYADLVQSEGDGSKTVFDSMLSEEGGRFYHSQQIHRLVEIEAGKDLDVAANYIWMTLRQVQECGRYNNHLNIEMRSILSCVSPLIED